MRSLFLGLVLLLLATPVARTQDRIAFDTLTVPPANLPQGCALSSPREAGIGMAIPSNPWLGNDPSIVIPIRERVGRPTQVPDGPPLSRSELARFRSRLAEDVLEAYMAVYKDSSTEDSRLISVYAVRFSGPAEPRVQRNRDARGGSLQIVRDDTVILLTGRGACFDAVATFITSVLPR